MTERRQLLQIGNGREQLLALDHMIQNGIDAGSTGERSLERWRGAHSVPSDRERARPWSGANRSSGQQKTTGAPTPIVSPLIAVIDELRGFPERSERSAPSKLF